VLIPLLSAHAIARTQCACQKLVLDQYGDHVLTCKKHTGAITGHDHVMNVSAQLACNRRLRDRNNRKVANTAAHTSHSEGDHRPLRLSGLPAAHTFFGVIPQSPTPYLTVHSVKCNWSAPLPSGLPPSPQRQSLYIQ